MASKSKYGFAALNSNLNSQLTGNSNLGQKDNSSARVISVVLNESHPRFLELGGWSALGAIEYNFVNNPRYNDQKYPVAYPLYPNIKNYPLVNEIVIILSAFTSGANLFEQGINITSDLTKKYYSSIVSVWNHPHHNGCSFKINDQPATKNKTYDQIEAGSVSIAPDVENKLFLGDSFVERSNIHPLLPFEGDVFLEGRWSNSIRLGSTISGVNPWSKTGDDGDPIMIIRNGQGFQNNEGILPIIENINNDDSSIYLTSTQNIPLKAASTSYTSYATSSIPPVAPNQYNGAQILLNSGRLVFNSYSDHILLSSAKSISLNSKKSINLDTSILSIQSNNIYLGKDKATEPLMLGKQTTNLLKDLVDSLTTFMTIAAEATTNDCVPGKASTLPTINSAAQDVLDDLFNLSKTLGSDPELKDCNLTSKRNYTV